MIVTRRRRKPFPFGIAIGAVVAIGLAAFAFSWPPLRVAILAGPLGVPFRLEGLQQGIAQRDRQIVALQAQVAAAQRDAQEKQRELVSVRRRLARLTVQTAYWRAPSPRTIPHVSANAAATLPAPPPTTAAEGDAFAPSSVSSMQRTAQYWASMEPENAAKVVQRLSPGYVARVFALMQPDAVGAILDAVPVAYAARVSDQHFDLPR